jgi:hypothetical protein
MAMKRIQAKQLTLALSVITSAVLAAAVFAWGSEYKCSLYHKHPEKHPRIAVAKLLSEQERPMAARAGSWLRAPLQQVVFFAPGVLVFEVFSKDRPGFERRIPPVQSDTAAHRTPCLTHFSFRPPPSIAA